MCRLFRLAQILALAVMCQGQEQGSVSPAVGLSRIMSVLSRANVSGSLEYWGSCVSGRPDLPNLRAPHQQVKSPVQALRDIFGGDPNMRVKQDRSGIIRMVETDVPRDLLDLRISHISFSTEAMSRVYDPKYALRMILQTPEVNGFMKAHNIGPPFDFENANGGAAIPSEKSPYMAGNLRDVTLSQALDHVLRVFPGLWIYENCPSDKRKRAVDFTIYQNSGGWTLVEHAGGVL